MMEDISKAIELAIAAFKEKFGEHHVSANMAGNFEKIRKERVK